MSAKISFKTINALAIPALFAGIVEPLISLTDSIVAGHLENSEITLGAVGLVSAFISALVWILAQTKSAISAFVSKAVGQNSLYSTQSLVSQLLSCNVLISIILALSTFYFSEEIFSLQKAEGEILQNASQFYSIRVWGFPLTLITFTIFGVFRGMQNTIWAMRISFVGGFLNILLDYIFAFPLQLGIEGIAYASVIAQLVMFILTLYYFFTKTKFRLQPLFPLHKDFKALVFMSSNLYLRAIMLNFTFWICNSFATALGNSYISAQSALIQIWLFSAFLLDGYAAASNAITGKLLGETDSKNILKLSYKVRKLMLYISIIMMVIYSLGYFYIGSFFTNNQEVRVIFNQYFWLVILMQPINALAFLYDGIFKGLGRAKILRNVLFYATFFGFLPAIYLLNTLNIKLYSVWIALFIWMLIRSFGLVFQLKKWFE